MSVGNSVSLIGRLTRDVEAPANNGPARFSIAINRRKKVGEEWQDEAHFIDCEYWHRSILQYLTKGKEIAVEGELKQDRWTDKEGNARSRIVVAVGEIKLLGGQASANAPKEEKPRSESPRDMVYEKTQAPATADFNDDIPF